MEKEKLSENVTIAIVGLGYVGMPLALSFAKRGLPVLGFDIDEERIAKYQAGIDPTDEVGEEALRTTTAEFTSDETRLSEANFIIVAVPTPTRSDKTPDLNPIRSASATVGRNLRKGAIVVYESTVYPGATEDVCVPILEQESGMSCGVDFFIGYSPERINPGDDVHRLEGIVKVVSGMDEATLNRVAEVYETIIDAGVFRASSIKVAEACKVIENSQRDINIAFMNEVAMAFDRMGIDTADVVDAMDTKWNALGFRPGLVGGHCIGVDPYYFLHKAGEVGYTSQLVMQGRTINEGMVTFVGKKTVDMLLEAGLDPRTARIAVLGVTFKEDCPDVRNSKAIELIEYLTQFANAPQVADCVAEPELVKAEYGIDLVDVASMQNLDCIVLAVPHEAYRHMAPEDFDALFAKESKEAKVFIDVKSARTHAEAEAAGWRYWWL